MRTKINTKNPMDLQSMVIIAHFLDVQINIRITLHDSLENISYKCSRPHQEKNDL